MANQSGTVKSVNSGRLEPKQQNKGGHSIITYEIAGPATYKDATGADSWKETLRGIEKIDGIVGVAIYKKYDGSGDDVAQATQVAATQYRAHLIAVDVAAGLKNNVTIMVTTLAGVQVADDVDLSTYCVYITVEGI